ncbi:hypothetical protein ACFU96_21790 [Streptomyces sp. NPDC057620]|uniref:hypothetical protein n=1 Tax=Streptomyces sp. NPDC057620 TaxID=3346185 RepID=UPI003694CFCB
MNAELFRVPPRMGPEAYKTYAVVSPLGTHFRPATCAESGCAHYIDGWQVRVEGLPPEMVHAAKASGRKYQEQQVAPGETWLVFEAGQACFRESQHRVRVSDRPPLYVVRDGDHRGNPRGTKARVHHSPDNWLDDFATHQQAIKDEIEKG